MMWYVVKCFEGHHGCVLWRQHQVEKISNIPTTMMWLIYTRIIYLHFNYIVHALIWYIYRNNWLCANPVSTLFFSQINKFTSLTKHFSIFSWRIFLWWKVHGNVCSVKHVSLKMQPNCAQEMAAKQIFTTSNKQFKFLYSATFLL